MTHPCIALAHSDEEIAACFPLMQQLRPQLMASTFVEQIREQERHGYHVAFLQVSGQVSAVAGFRISQCLAWGKFLYVDDLVTDAEVRSQGYGKLLFQWLMTFAQREGCQKLCLDSGVQRFAAHRFYHQQRMSISSHHFVLDL